MQHSCTCTAYVFGAVANVTSLHVSDTKAAFGGSPPLWVYAQMSKPMLALKGFRGYKNMYQLSLKAALEYKTLHRGEVAGIKDTTTTYYLGSAVITYFSSLAQL